MTDIAIDDLAEDLVRAAAETLVAPRGQECLLCYVARMLEEFRCDGTLRFAVEYRDRRAPRATTLAGRLAAVGGCCDCEIFLNGWSPHPRLWSPGHTEIEGGVTYRTDPQPPDELPPCAGVRASSSRPCPLWVRRTRAGRW
jgi:hypothetical protein